MCFDVDVDRVLQFGLRPRLRFGLVGFIAGFFLFNILVDVPLTTDPSAWYAGTGLAAVLLVRGIAVAAFVISVGGRPSSGGWRVKTDKAW